MLPVISLNFEYPPPAIPWNKKKWKNKTTVLQVSKTTKHHVLCWSDLDTLSCIIIFTAVIVLATTQTWHLTYWAWHLPYAILLNTPLKRQHLMHCIDLTTTPLLQPCRQISCENPMHNAFNTQRWLGTSINPCLAPAQRKCKPLKSTMTLWCWINSQHARFFPVLWLQAVISLCLAQFISDTVCFIMICS